MAAKPAGDLGSISILAEKGQGRAVSPEQVAGEDSRRDTPSGVQDHQPEPASNPVGREASQAGQGALVPGPITEHLPARQEDAERASWPLALGFEPDGAQPTKALQIKLDHDLAQTLKLMATLKNTTQQALVEPVIRAMVDEWRRRRAGG
jgi:hypothetical protein